MASIQFALAFASAAGVLALPTPNTTEVQPAWVPEPRGRGTFSLLLSCIVTLVLCIWTAIHDDVIPNPTFQKRLTSKLAWMLLSLFIPEIVIAHAISQWKEARKLHRFWCNHFKVKAGSKGDRLGMEGAFFVIMGGFASGPCDHFSRYPSTISPADFKRLIDTGVVSPNTINRKLIMDKGKADTLAKLLVCIQTLWMVAQCAARKISGLPVTLLEFHVVVQVLCTMAVYGFWWYKPSDVSEPIPIIEHQELAGLLSIVYDEKDPIMMGVIQHPRANDSTQPPAENYFIARNPLTGIPPKPVAHPIGNVIIVQENYSVTAGTMQPQINLGSVLWSVDEVTERKRGNDVLLCPRESLVAENDFLIKYCGPGGGSHCILDKTDIENFHLQASAIRDDSNEKQAGESEDSEKEHLLWAGWTRKLRKIKPQEPWMLFSLLGKSIFTDSTRGRDKAMFTISMLYGGAHSIAWNSHFPTSTERILWRIACVGTLCTPLIIALSEAIEFCEDREDWFFQSIYMVLALVLLFGLVTPVVCSMYFNVEAFLSVRSLVDGTYETIPWGAYWPHI